MTPVERYCATRMGPGHRHRAWLDISLFAVGVGLFTVLLWTIGTAPITEALARIGPGLALIVGVELLAILANTLSWRYAIAPAWRSNVPFVQLIAARVVGDALNYVIPAGAGEIAKFRLLSRYMPVESALASVVLARLTEGIALGVFGCLGLLAAWPSLATSPTSTAAVALAAVIGVGVVVSSLVAVRFGLVTRLVRLVQWLRAEEFADSRPGVTATVAEGRAGRVMVSTAWHLAGWLVNVAELWLTCYFLGLHPSLGVVFAGEALAALFDVVFFLVPMKIGVAEGGRVFVFALLGFSPAQGLTLGLVRRVRELTWITIGLAIYPWVGMRAAPSERRNRCQSATAVNP